MNKHGDIDQRIQDLLNGGLDGELSLAEQEELNELLAKSAEVRELDQELRAFHQLMDTLPELEPPQYLQETIERQVRLPVQNTGPDEKRGLFGNWLSANWLRTGLALAAGVLLTVGVYEMGSEPISEHDATNLVGTVVKNQVPAQTNLLDRVQLTNDLISGFVELHQAGDLFTLDVLLSSDELTELLIDYGERGLSFEGLTSVPQQVGAVKMDDGLLTIVGSGERLYTLKLKSDTGKGMEQAMPLELTFYINDALIQEAAVRISGK